MNKNLLNLENEKLKKEQLETWLKCSQKIDAKKIEMNPIDIASEEWNNFIAKLSKENVEFPQIKAIIELLSTQ